MKVTAEGGVLHILFTDIDELDEVVARLMELRAGQEKTSEPTIMSCEIARLDREAEEWFAERRR